MPFIIVSPPVLLALLWDITEALAIKVKDHRRGLPPPSVLAMDLIVWLALAGCNVGLGFIGMTGDLNDVLRPGLGSYRQGTIPPNLRSKVQEVAYMALTVVALVSVLTALHVSTFSIACYETHMRNRKPEPVAQSAILVMQNGNGPTAQLASAVPVTVGGQVLLIDSASGQPPQKVYYVPVQAVPVGCNMPQNMKAALSAQPEYTGVRQHQAAPAVPLIQRAGKK
ncbi:hypothetical protein QBC34DRAFT_442229 [Podospora aff. communis PSN243]|uniref:Uncharacterized protein n=1 Tax=Podospora aff. communis PSN243 TaxID=3040156 RepID=A0AAV9GBI7_9PEZI|nr:hypothetical protein QBC34DRAFT_442229 [Podospora aff. communis PSN243]